MKLDSVNCARIRSNNVRCTLNHYKAVRRTMRIGYGFEKRPRPATNETHNQSQPQNPLDATHLNKYLQNVIKEHEGVVLGLNSLFG